MFNKEIMKTLIHIFCKILLHLTFLFSQKLNPALEELKDLREFHDPDTVQLMEWIKYVLLHPRSQHV